jgi:hypothetical protein
MIAIVQYMQEHGFAAVAETTAAGTASSLGQTARPPHLSASGIWRKLRTLYNLDAIDERVQKTRFAAFFFLPCSLVLVTSWKPYFPDIGYGGEEGIKGMISAMPDAFLGCLLTRDVLRSVGELGA